MTKSEMRRRLAGEPQQDGSLKFGTKVAEKFDPVEKPAHYNQGKIEVCDFILDQKMDYLEGNIVKYVSRYKFKNGLQDLQKAKWYLERLIRRVQEAQNASERNG